MKWEQVSLEKNRPNFPGCIDLDISGSSFVSATFETSQGVFRIRKSDYSTVIEKKVVPSVLKYIVSHSTDGVEFIETLFNKESDADRFYTTLENANVQVTRKTENVEVKGDSQCLI